MCIKLPKSCVNFIFLCKFDKEPRCFLEKITQLGRILHDRRSRQSRQISSLRKMCRKCVACSNYWYIEATMPFYEYPNLRVQMGQVSPGIEVISFSLYVAHDKNETSARKWINIYNSRHDSKLHFWQFEQVEILFAKHWPSRPSGRPGAYGCCGLKPSV